MNTPGYLINIWLLFLFAFTPLYSQEKAVLPYHPVTEKATGSGRTVPTISGLNVSPESAMDVLHYAFDLTVIPDASTIQGHAAIQAQIPHPGSQNMMVLDLIGLEVDSVWLNEKTADYSYGGYYLVIDFPSQFDPTAPFTIEVWYKGQPQNDDFGGFFFTPKIIYTVGEGIYSDPPSMARYWLPCNDTPSDKASLNLKITVPKGLLAFANGLLAHSEARGDWQTFHWQETHPIATYLIALAIGDLKTFSIDYKSERLQKKIPIEFYTYPELLDKARVDFANVGKMMAFFEQAFGPYPFDRYSMVSAPMRGAMEHQTMTTFSDFLIDGTGTHDDIVAHELAHHWWGNSVTLTDWREIWLNEGFASYSEALYAESQQGQAGLLDRMGRFRSRYINEVGRLGAFPIYDPQYLWTATVYDKGAWILHMLRWQVGENNFKEILQSYAEQYRYGNATIADFRALAEKISNQDLEQFFRQWLEQAGHPELEIDWDFFQSAGGQWLAQLHIAQVQTLWPLFQVPMEIRLEGYNFTRLDTLPIRKVSDTFDLKIPGPVFGLEVDPNNWLLKTVKIKSTPLPPGFMPGEYGLAQNFPNPFNDKTTILLQVGQRNKPIKVKLAIRDVIGRKIVDLVDNKLPPGIHRYSWDGNDRQGRPVTSGIYFYSMEAGDFYQSKQMILAR